VINVLELLKNNFMKNCKFHIEHNKSFFYYECDDIGEFFYRVDVKDQTSYFVFSTLDLRKIYSNNFYFSKNRSSKWTNWARKELSLYKEGYIILYNKYRKLEALR